MKRIFTIAIVAMLGLWSIPSKVTAQCSPAQSSVTFTLDMTNDSWPAENAWKLVLTQSGTALDSACFSTYSGGVQTLTACLDTGLTYSLYAYDSFGDGLDGAEYRIEYTYGPGIDTIGAIELDIPSLICGVTEELEDSTSFYVAYFPAPNCLSPDTLTASNITSTSADLNWFEPNSATEWEIEYGTTGFTPGTGTIVNITSALPYNLSGLTGATTYDYYVRSICAVGDTSSWSNLASFTTCPTGTVCNTYIAGDISTDFGFQSIVDFPSTCPDTLTLSIPSGNRIDSITTSYDMTTGSGAWMSEQVSMLYCVNTLTGEPSVTAGTGTTGTFSYNRSGLLFANGATGSVDIVMHAGRTWGGSGCDPSYNKVDNGTWQIIAYYSAIPPCQQPTALSSTNNSNSLGSSVSLSWTENNSATEWEIEYGITGFTQGTGTIVNTTSNPDTLMGLSTQTTYDWYVRSICSTTDTSGWSLMGSFTTPCAAYTAPFFENFDTLALVSPYTDLPNCWEPQVGPDYWDVTDDIVNTGHTYLPNIGDHTTGSSNYMWIDASSDITTNAMITPFIDVSGLSTPYVGFWFASNNTTNTINHTIALDAWDGSAWVNITTEIGNFPTWVKVADTLPSSIPSLTRFKIYAIANPSGTTSDYYYNDLGVDDFFVEEAPTCIAVDTLTASNPTNTSMDLSWVDPNSATEWQIEYGTTGFTQGTGTYVTVNSAPPYTLGGLTAYQTYDFYVRAVCAVGDSSAWSGPSTFTVGLPLAGNYTIDSTQAASSTNFQSFADFANILGLVGVSANVNVDVVPNSGPYNQQVIFNSYNGASAGSSVSINANGEVVEYAPASSDKRIIGFDNASYISITNLKVVGLDPTYGFGIHFTNNSHHISIDSSEVDLTLTTSTSSVNVGGIISSGSFTSMTTTGNNASNISITNSKIDGGVSGMYYAVRFNGNSSSDLDSLIRFENNEVANFYAYGIYLNHIKNSYVGGNDVHRADKQSVTTFYGITTGGGSTNDTINANRIHNTHGSATSTTGSAYGIYNTSNDADATTPNLFVNNLIYDFNSTSGLIYGIYNLGSDNQAYINNSLSIDYTAATGGTTRGFYQTTTASGITFGNNNISITRGGTGTKHGIYLNTSTSTVTSNFNNIYVNSAGSGSQYVGRESATDQATLANWQTTTYDANSVSADPLFLNAIGGDLTPAEGTLNGTGFNYGVPVDFNGVIRSTPPDIGAFEFTPPSCLPPSAFVADSITGTSIILNWIESGTATEWIVQYDTAGFTLGLGIDSVVTAKPISINNLVSTTDYEFYVRAVCSVGDSSSWVGPLSVKTLIQGPQGPNCTTGSPSVVFSEDFDSQGNWSGNWGTGGTNDTWNIRSGTTTSSNTGPSGAHSGNNYVYFETSGSSSTPISIVSPAIDLTQSVNSAELSFWMHAYGATIGTLDIGVSNSQSGPFTNIFSWTGELQTAESDPFIPVGVDLDSYVGQTIYIEIAYTRGSSFTGDLAIDLLEITSCVSCPNPTNLTYTPTSTTSADISWTSPTSAANAIVEYGAAGFTLGTGTQIVSTSTTESITGLAPNVAYQAYVKDSCAVGDASAWAGPITFGGDMVPCDDFDSYTAGNAASQSILINGWGGTVAGGGDAEFSTDYANSGTQSLKIYDSGTNTFSDVVAELDTYNSGTWNVAIDIYVPATYGGYYNMLHSYTGATNVWAFEVYLDANGTATVEEGTNGSDTIGVYSYITGAWNTIEHIIDLDNDTAYIQVNGVNTNVGWQFSLGSTNFGDQFNAMNFYSSAPGTLTPLAYFDNFCVTEVLPHYPIGIINTEDANGDADSVNVECSISGTVVGYDRRGGGGYEFALVDLSSGFQEGITVFDFNDVSGYTNPAEGDSLLIFGSVDQFRGLTQFRPDSIVVLGTGTVPMPDTATTLDETTESILIQMNDWVLLDSTQASGSYNVTARSLDSTTTITIRIDSDSEISDSLAVVGNGWVVGDTICSLVGVGGQFDGFSSPFLGGYQVFPSLYADVTVCRLSTGIINVAAKAKSINIYPNPTVGQFTVKSSGLNNDNALVTVRDISGRIVLQDNIAQSNSPFTKQYDLSGKAKGLYFISIIDGEERINQKLIVQ